MARKVLRQRRTFAVVGVTFIMAALAVLPGGAMYRPVPAAAADAPPITVAKETLNALANVHPGDHVKVVVQSTIPLQFGALGGGVGTQDGYCPPGIATPAASDFGTACGFPVSVGFAAPADIPKAGLHPDPNGRYEFTLIIPDQGFNVIPPTPGHNANEINCSPGGHPCSFGFVYRYTPVGGTLQTAVDVTSLSFTENAAPQSTAGCSAPQPDKLISAAGPARITDATAAWTRDRCAGTKPQDLDVTEATDVSARDGFRDGQSDIFFGAGGVTAEEDAKNAAKRKAVPIPVGLNAMVLAVDGKFAGPSVGINKRPIQVTDVKLTAKQLADLMIEPEFAFKSGPFVTDMLSNNPQIAPMGAARNTVNMGAYASAEVGHSLVSRYLAGQAPDVWKYPDSGEYGQNAGKPIGELWQLDSMNPQASAKWSFVSNRPDMSKLVDGDFLSKCIIPTFATSAADGCLDFVLTDAATAAFFKLPVAQIQNPAGQFVAPTQQSLAAAAEHMTSLPDGSKVANLSSTDKNAYPLTFAEYAYAPAKAMVDGDCKASAKQALLNDELTFMVDHPQDLAPGMMPLSSSLAEQARTNLPKVGSERPSCAGSSGGTNGGLPGALSGAGATGPGGPGTAALPAPAGALGNHPTRPSTTAGQQAALQTANETRIPPFAGLAALVLLIPLSALALTNAVTSGTAFGAAGRPLPPRLQKVVNALSRALDLAMRPVRRLVGS